MSRRLELSISPELEGSKVDTILKKRLGLSGTVVRRIKWWPDGILLDGQRVQTDARPQVGQLLSVRLDDLERRSGIVPAPGPLGIIMILWVIFCSGITIWREILRTFTRSIGWTVAPPACWWRPNTPMPRRF